MATKALRDPPAIARPHSGAEPTKQADSVLDILAGRLHAAPRRGERTAYLRALLESCPVAILELNRAGRARCVNRAFEELFGYRQEEVLNRTPEETTAPGKLAAGARAFRKRSLRGVVHATGKRMRKDGTLVDVKMRGAPLAVGGQTVGSFTLYEEITEQQRDQQDLRKAEAKYRTIFENVLDGIVERTPDGRVASVNTAMARMLGFETAEEMMAAIEDFDEFACVDPGARDRFTQMMAEHGIFEGFEYRVRRRDGSVAWHSENSRVVRGASGEIAGYVSTIRDVTERKRRELERQVTLGSAIERARIEEAPTDREAHLRLLLDQLPALLWTTDREPRITSSLGAGLAGVGLKSGEMTGMSLEEFFAPAPPDFPPLVTYRRALEGEVLSYPFSWRERLFECHVEPLRDGDGRIVGTIGMALDTTDRRVLEDQLRQSQKMEAVGRLAGGIAHDFNNLLMVIRGYSELLLENAKPGDANYRGCEQIQKAADRAASLTRQLLAFSRKQVAAPTVLDLNSVVNDVGRMLRRLIGEDIELVTLTQPGLGKVKADRAQIEQVILNLAVNSRDAMPGGGKLTMEVSNAEFDEAYCRRHAYVQPGRYVMLAVSDTGCGMDMGTQAHIFEPFFTTKPTGTGLGLSTVYGVVKQSGGHIGVYSEPKRGTVMKAYFPRLDLPEEEEAASSKPQTVSGTETILLVEDEEGVRTLAREFLERGGYTVLEAANGAEALRIAREFGGQIHLLVTDVIMPQISGREIAERITRIRPNIKILFMSGYTDDAIDRHGVFEQGAFLLEKPFDRRSLWLKIREVLEADARRRG